MSKFRKKPVVIEAVEYRGDNTYAEMAPWLSEAIGSGVVTFHPAPRGELIITTLEGEHLASPGDVIIQGVKGELYPCKPDIFAATYEAVDA